MNIALKYIYTLVTALTVIFSAHLQASEDKPFLIVVHAHNNKDWVKKNLDSLMTQSYTPFKVIYIDDASSDGTGSSVEEYIQKNSLQEKISLIKNERPIGALPCLFQAIQDCPSETIIMPMDGCNWLAHRNVLQQINHFYADSNIWLTYGQYCSYPTYTHGYTSEVSETWIENNEARDKLPPSASLKTFYAGLFQQIHQGDLISSGTFSSDRALFVPLIELAGKHSKYIPDIHFVYNIAQNKNILISAEQPLYAKAKYPSLANYSKKAAPKKIYITPGFWGELFAIDNPIFNRDNCLEVLYRLRETAREEGYEIYQANDLDSIEDFEYLIVFDVFLDQLKLLSRFPKEKKILFLWEPPSVIPENYVLENHKDFAKVITWNDSLVDNEKYFKFFYPVIRPLITDIPNFESKKLCTLIACNKDSDFPDELYSERRNLIYFYEKKSSGDFTLYGKWWPNNLLTYAGSIDKKVDTLKHFRFCYAYENIRNISGYITEKIFDCFQAGTVPIYWGAPNISSYIPNNCYISREDFANDTLLYCYLKSMNETTYQEYQQNIRLYLESEQAKLYSQDHFISLFMKLISTPIAESQP